MINPAKTFNIHDYIEIIWRRIWYILIPFGVILAGTVLYAYFSPKEYRASTLILVTPQKVPESFIKPTVTSRIEDRLQSIGQEIMSRTRLERVIDEFKLYSEEGKSLSREQIVELMKKNIEVDIKKDAYYFTISYVGQDPKTVTLVTNKLASLFIEENLKSREQQAQGTSEFLAVELSSTKAKLEKQEKIIAEFKRKFMGELPEQREANLRVLDQLQAQYQRLGDNFRAAQDRKLMLEKQLADLQNLFDSDNKQGEDETLEMVEDQGSPLTEKKDPQEIRLDQLKNQLQDLQMKYTEKHPEVLIIKRKISELEKEVERTRMAREAEKKNEAKQTLDAAAKTKQKSAAKLEKRKVKRDIQLDPRYREARDRLMATEREMERLREEDGKVKARIASYQERVERTFSREQDLALLTRDYSNSKETYESLLRKSQEAQQAENLERHQKGEQFKVIDSAKTPEAPFKPNIPKTLLIGLLGGMACGLAAAFLREQMDRSFRDAEDLETVFGFKVLANIPRIENKAP